MIHDNAGPVPATYNTLAGNYIAVTKYVRGFQSRRSPLIWKVFGKRLDGLTKEAPKGKEAEHKRVLAQGGGVAVTHTTGGATPYTPNLTLTDCVVTGNEADYGGGIAIRSYGWLQLFDTVVTSNDADVAGGGLWMQDYGTLECTASALGGAGFTANSASIAGAVYLSNSTSGTVEAVGTQLFTKTVVPFELATALLIVAVVGAIAVARSRHQAPKKKQSPSPTRRFFHGPLHPRDAGRPLTGEEL